MNDESQREPRQTRDGSHTLYSNRFSQHYHNFGGAVAESRHLFFEQNGLIRRLKSASEPLTILETGFGTGLNLMLLLEAVRRTNCGEPLLYFAVEGWPLAAEEAGKLNYGEHVETGEDDLPERIFKGLSPGWNRLEPAEKITLRLFYGLFEDFEPGEVAADYIFHDPFSPGVNPGMWTAEVFRKLLGMAAPAAILTTYCAASRARGAMCHAGWKVARAAGALGKREMTVASPDPARLEMFDRVNEERLADRYSKDDFD